MRVLTGLAKWCFQYPQSFPVNNLKYSGHTYVIHHHLPITSVSGIQTKLSFILPGISYFVVAYACLRYLMMFQPEQQFYCYLLSIGL